MAISFKENVPPMPLSPGPGLVAKMGGYEEKQRQLRLQRNQEYNQLLAEFGDSYRQQPQWMPDNPPPPRRGWATPSYQDILERKRQEEQNYRRYSGAMLPPTGKPRIGEPGYNRISISDGDLYQRFQEADDQLERMDQEYERKKVKFADEPIRSQSNPMYWPNGETLRTRQNRLPANGGFEEETYGASLPIGRDVRMSEEHRKKSAYGRELLQQIEESKAIKQRDNMYRKGIDNPQSDRFPAGKPPLPSFVNNTNSYQRSNSNPRLAFNDPEVSRFPRDPYMDRIINYPSHPRNEVPRVDYYGNSLFPNSNVTYPYNIPNDDEYRFYAQQNPLDANAGIGVMSMVPSYAQNYPQSLYPAPQPPLSAYQPPQPSNGRYSAFPDANPSRNMPGLNDAQREGADDKKRAYQQELLRQMEQDKLKKQREKEEKERYDRKLEEEIANYNPFGRGGGGAPMRDANGNVITSRKPGSQVQTESNGYPASQPAPDYNSLQQPSTFNVPDFYSSPEPNKGVGTPYNDNGEQNYARGGHGIFGEPMTDEQKKGRLKYQDELRLQIEAKKLRDNEEKERERREDELLSKKLQEDQLRMEQEEREKEEKRRKEEVEKEQERIRRQQELEEQRKKDIEEKRRLRDEQRQTPNQPYQDRDKIDPSRHSSANRSSRRPPPSPVVPAKRNESRQQRAPSSEVLNELAKMKHQLHSERRRVETDLETEKHQPVVYDARILNRPLHDYDIEVVQLPRNRPSSETISRIDSGDQFATTPLDRDTLERQQQALLNEQENLINKLKSEYSDQVSEVEVRKFVFDSVEVPPEEDYDLLSNILHKKSPNNLDSRTAFIGVPNDMRSIPEDLEDLDQRRTPYWRRQFDSPTQRYTPFGRPNSNTSLDPDELRRINHNRLKRLKSLAGDDLSNGEPDDILEKFLKRQRHNRPPSNYTLAEDRWLKPDSGNI